jgi:hypothetical protein
MPEMHEGQLTEIYDSLIDNLALSRNMLASPIPMYLFARRIQNRRIKRGGGGGGGAGSQPGQGADAFDDQKSEQFHVPWLPAGVAFSDLVCSRACHWSIYEARQTIGCRAKASVLVGAQRNQCKAANRKRVFTVKSALVAALQNKCTDEIPYYIRAKSYADFFEAMIGAAYIVASTTAAYQVLKVRRNGPGTDPDWCLLIDRFI